MIDLHTHSTASDGTDNPEELVKKAASSGITTLALTDHDTLQGLDEAEETAVSCRMNFVRGCEVSTSIRSAHMVALWVPRQSASVGAFLEKQEKMREARNLAILENLKKLGVHIGMDELKGRGAGSIGRNQIADILLERGLAKDRDAAFAEYLDSRTGKAYAPKAQAPHPFDVIKLFNSVGATVVMAHPFLMRLNKAELDKFVFDAKRAGLSAIEAWHSEHTEEQSEEAAAMAKKHGLALSGGSDYHGGKKPLISLGSGRGSLNIPESVYENLRDLRRSKGLPV